MENTTTVGVSQAAVSDSNRHSSPSPTAERSSDPTRSSQPSLCNICARGLILDDRRAGGALEEPHKYGAPNLCFPSLGFRDISYRRLPGTKHVQWEGDAQYKWEGGAQYEQRDITPPHLPELSDECKFCRTVKSMIIHGHRYYVWWQTTTTKVRFKAQYEWRGEKEEGRPFDFYLVSLNVELEHPEIPSRRQITFPIATWSGSCQKWLHITGRPLDVESSFSEKNVNLIRSWLEECKRHPSCCNSTKKEYLPTRLLDVGAQGSNDTSITLVDTRSMAQLNHADLPLKYICLSYTWGAAEPPLKTTKGTIEGYKAGIPIDSMPRVFRDAVLVTRTLGIRYLWIDALCIIQDCLGDWHNEASAMAATFSHSWMTIGAATTSSCHETLFPPREDISIDIEFRSSIKPDIAGTISILLLEQNYYHIPLWTALENSTWNTRGWVWQEQELSQRLLIFGEKMLHFRCRKRQLHEYGRHYGGGSFAINYESSLAGPDEWTGVMCRYSRRELSKQSDRMAAISGYVKAVAQELEDAGKPATYIAGIWLTEDAEVDLELSWLIEDPTISFGQLLRYHSDRQRYIAPSWSWAALSQPVETVSVGGMLEFEVVAHNIMPARTDPMVAIAPGSSITLLGNLRKIPGRPSLGIKSSTGWTSATHWDAPYSYDEDIRRVRRLRVDEKISYFLDWDPSAQDFDEGDPEAHLELFLLGSRTTGAHGLILFRDVVNSGFYLRVGCFSIDGPWGSADWKETEVVLI